MATRIDTPLMRDEKPLFVLHCADGSRPHPQAVSRELYHLSYLKKRYSQMKTSLEEIRKKKKKPSWQILIYQFIFTGDKIHPKIERLSDFLLIIDEERFEKDNFRMSGNMIYCRDLPIGLLHDIVTKKEFKEKYAHLQKVPQEMLPDFESLPKEPKKKKSHSQ